FDRAADHYAESIEFCIIGTTQLAKAASHTALAVVPEGASAIPQLFGARLQDLIVAVAQLRRHFRDFEHLFGAVQIRCKAPAVEPFQFPGIDQRGRSPLHKLMLCRVEPPTPCPCKTRIARLR